MIDKQLLSLVSMTRPRMNAEICNGIAITQSHACERYIHDIFRSLNESLPSVFRYVGYERCTPYEEFNELTRPLKPKRSFEITESNVYMVKYKFTFEGKPLRNRYILLPIVGEGGIIYLKGTQYKISPVIGGRVFNIERGSVFMATPRARLMFKKISTSFVMNERISHADVVWSPLYNISNKSEGSKLFSTLIHYCLAEYGLTQMFKRFFDIDVKLGYSELDELMETGEWFVYRSRGVAPVGYARTRGKYNPNTIRIAIPAGKHSQTINSIVAGIFYIIDNFPESVTLEEIDNSEMWLRLLSAFIFRYVNSEQKMFDEMTAHMDSIRHYMDPITREGLMKEGVVCSTIFDLFNYINCNFQDMVIHHDVGSMYNLELTTVKHLLYDVTYNIFSMMFQLKKLTGDRLTYEKVTNVMDKTLRRDNIFKVSKHGELSADSIATDCKPYSATCNLVSQSKASTAGRSQKHNNAMADPTLLLHPSQVEVGSYQMMSKAEPSGRSKANPFMFFSERNYVAANPEMEEYINHFAVLIKR